MSPSEFNYFLASWAPTVIGAFFAFCFGACAGSFLNVLVWRLPTGQSVVTPPSRCPTCGHRLSWRENLPLFGWLLLRGQCRACKSRISLQYPAVELLMALLFAAAFVMCYAPLERGGGALFADAASPWWQSQGFGLSWPAFALGAIAISGLVAMTIVDARTMLIPIEIPTAVTAVAFVGWTVQGLVGEVRNPRDMVPLPTVGWPTVLGSAGMLLGLGISRWLIASGRLRASFADWQDYISPSGEEVDYPHARREMGLELAFLAPGVGGAAIGVGIAVLFGSVFAGSGIEGSDAGAAVPRSIEFLGSSMFGWIVGGGLVWAVRILGTLAFGREAMGLGDVHLQAAVGAAFGWKVALLAFFVAVFLALAWAVVAFAFGRFTKFLRKEIPFGPHLAVAAILFVVARGPIVAGLDGFTHGIVGVLRHMPGVGERVGENRGRSFPAELAQPRDQR